MSSKVDKSVKTLSLQDLERVLAALPGVYPVIYDSTLERREEGVTRDDLNKALKCISILLNSNRVDKNGAAELIYWVCAAYVEFGLLQRMKEIVDDKFYAALRRKLSPEKLADLV